MVGQAIYAMRQNRRMKRSELTKRAGVVPAVAWAIETGARFRQGAQVRTLEKIADGLGISVSELFSPKLILMADPLIQAIVPLVRRLSPHQRAAVLKTLKAIGQPSWLKR